MRRSRAPPIRPRPLTAYVEPHPQARDWRRGAVIYHVYPRSFRDTNGDGVGDLQGILDKLDYIAHLEVDAIWLSPFFRSPMNDFGYDVADYCSVDPIFGALADFDAIVAAAHDRGLKVIIDQVYSHTSDRHQWFQESRQDRTNAKADWYVWANAKDDGAPPSNWQSVFGGPAWTWDGRRRQYYLHNFLSSQPDLNLHNPAVQDALLEVAKFWLDRGVDGFRLDAINFVLHDPALRDNPPAPRNGPPPTRPFDYQRHLFNQSHPDIPSFLERIRELTNAYDDILTVAEVVGPAPLSEMKSFTRGDARLSSAYNFAFLYADDISPKTVKEALRPWGNAPGDGWPSWAFSNHDAPRAVSRWADDALREDAAKLFLMLLMTLRGNAFLYQGEELGLPQADVPFDQLKDPEAIANWPLTLGRDGARTPMPWSAGSPNAGFSDGTPWLPVDPRHRDLAADRQVDDPSSVLGFTKSLLRVRSQSMALRCGDMTFLETPHPALAFLREAAGEEVLCLFNLGTTPADWRPPEALRFGDLLIALGVDQPDAPAPLPPYGGYIAKINR